MKVNFRMGILIISLFSLSACSIKEPSLRISTENGESIAEIKTETKEELQKDIPKDAREDALAKTKQENVIEKKNKEHDEKIIYAYICGAIINPGVYKLKEGDRIYHLVEAAGGLTKEADEKSLNQAKKLADGEQVTVYTKEEVVSGQSLGLEKEAALVPASSGKININTAQKEELMQISGVGSQRADAILQYRKENGLFSSVEEIMQVEGIKEGMFEKIKEEISVGG
ncbi:MAG TPA: helix-hairpin-helix domain-containing protein [Lachnospiraceae bacterium]